MPGHPQVPSPEHYELVRERLREAVQALAAPADAQIASMPDFVQWNTAFEIADDFDNWWRVLDGNYRGFVVADETSALQTLDQRLHELSGTGDDDLWTTEALHAAQEWEEVRRLAAAVAAACGWPLKPPPRYERPAPRSTRGFNKLRRRPHTT